MADFNWWSFLDPTALTYESYGKARDVMSPSSGFSYYAPGSATQPAYWAQKRGTSPFGSAAQQRLEAAKQLQAALRAQQSAAYAGLAAQAKSQLAPPVNTFAPPSFDSTEPSAADQSVIGGRSDDMSNPYLRGAYVLGAAANLPLKPPPRSAGFTVKSTTNGRTFTSFSVRRPKKYNPEQTRKNAEIAAKKAAMAGKAALDAIQKGKLASQKQQKPPPKGKSVMGWVLGATRGPRLGVAALKAMAEKTIDSGRKLTVTADKFQKSTIAFDAKKAADTAKAQRVSQMPRSMRAPQGGKRRTVMGATPGSYDVFGLLGITPGSYDVFGATPGSFAVGATPGSYDVFGETPGSFDVGRLGTHMPAYGTHAPDFGVDDDLLGAAEIVDYQLIGDDWMEIVGEGELSMGAAEWSEIVGDARQFNYEVLGRAVVNHVIGQDEPPADSTDTTSASGMPGPPDYGALAMMGLTAPPTIQDAIAIMTDEAERDPFPNGDDQTFWDCPTDDSLPVGAIVFNGSRPMTQDAQARGGVGNYSFYFGQLPGVVPKGGPGSGYSLHNDGWWLLLTGQQPSRDYSGGRNYDKTGAADSAMDFESQKNGWGPLIGNPYDWEKGLRFSPSGPSGPRWFWYFDQAPDWAKHAVVQQRLNDLMVQYQAAVTAGQADYVNAQIQDQLDQKAAADESRKSAAQDAELARQQQVFDQQQAQDTARQEAQAQALALQEAGTSAKLEEAQAAYFAAHPESMFTQMPEGGGEEGGEEPYYGEEEEAPPDWGDSGEEGF